jgi:phosphoribosylaminoimidazole-succinocarboxamide synthase
MSADPVHIPAFGGLLADRIPSHLGFESGKVRDIISADEKLVITTTDRISAFDSVLGLVPAKGEVLNQISLYWFDKTHDIIENHVLSQISARTIAVRPCRPLPVEVVVRGYLTGSAYRDYQAGEDISGISLGKGMRFNQRLQEPIITPTTKERAGTHDRPISEKEIADTNLVDPDVWQTVRTAALRLFARGSAIAAQRGLILVDTKYEFGTADGEIYLIDEIHTPDSSRYWFKDTYEELFEAGEKQRKLDKEYLRQWLMDRGYQGDGEPPDIPEEVFAEVSERYREAYSLITGAPLHPEGESPEAETAKILSYLE